MLLLLRECETEALYTRRYLMTGNPRMRVITIRQQEAMSQRVELTGSAHQRLLLRIA